MIAVRDLTHRFGDAVALDEVTLSIPDGQFCLLVGPNGSGKTTLVRHFNALLEPDSGTVTVDGTDVTADPLAARTAVGMVFQQPRDQLVAATVGADVAFGPENLGLDRDEIDRRVTSALSAVELDGREDAHVDTLSGGEQARVAIAGALAMEPTHLVLDEPFAGLDLRARRSLLARLDSLQAAGTSVVVVTHDLRDLRERADRVVALADGEIVADAPPDDIADLEAHGVDGGC
ncbi:energy-coupling factor ABC transporter ATP-binding protein [Haloarcula onubensis]|uniref:Energy-coupling factor ABC transporter ATP-binding protein n=1 Tax=Haloarcula onubensis TaxID=2950539 RepID=A0ABU2FIM8_9EURY|nr:ABC transporter ATP-binding protein [Halomicroarcula sp. S3CR25-11]MDS0280604.1 energy-coupling factor ABC transporter ATP-binding protein [Halomicroarcula sp. S3CR25-11]